MFPGARELMMNVMPFCLPKDWTHGIMGSPATNDDTVTSLDNLGSDVRINGEILAKSETRALVDC